MKPSGRILLYTALYDEASNARTELLEMAILLLIFIELVLALTR